VCDPVRRMSEVLYFSTDSCVRVSVRQRVCPEFRHPCFRVHSHSPGSPPFSGTFAEILSPSLFPTREQIGAKIIRLCGWGNISRLLRDDRTEQVSFIFCLSLLLPVKAPSICQPHLFWPPPLLSALSLKAARYSKIFATAPSFSFPCER